MKGPLFQRQPGCSLKKKKTWVSSNGQGKAYAKKCPGVSNKYKNLRKDEIGGAAFELSPQVIILVLF